MINNQLFYYNNPFEGQIPCCPFMQNMYMMNNIPNMPTMPGMMRSDDLENFDSMEPIDSDSDEDLTNENSDSEEERTDDCPIEYEKDQYRCECSAKAPSKKNADAILCEIERNNPEVIRMLLCYGIPYPEAIKIVHKIIHLTLMYSK